MTVRQLLLTGVIAVGHTAFCQPAPKLPPSPEEQAVLIAESRQRALAYSKSLPDFICTQVTRRSSAPVRPDRVSPWKLRDTLTIRLSYFGQKENYQVVRINNKPANKKLNQVGGWTSNGDFGSMLREVFLPKTDAKFEWTGWADWKGRRVAVLSYQIDLAHSQFNSTGQAFLRKASFNWAAKGQVYVDLETRQVLRITVDSMDMPAASPTREVHITLDYDFQKIGDGEFLLPSQSEVVMDVGREIMKSESQFTEYQKFVADATIHFDGK